MNFFHKIFRLFFLTLLLFGNGQVIFCQNEQTRLSYNGSRSYYLVERSDMRRYDNGKYTGLVNREVRSFIARIENPANSNPLDSYYDGSFFVSQDTVHAEKTVGLSIHKSVPSLFKIDKDGKLFMIEDHGFPSFRSFPAFSSEKIRPGEKWRSRAERAVDPLEKGVFTKIPMEVEYTYLRDEVFKGENVYVLSAQWATRYGISYFDFAGDTDLKSATGSHKATMYISRDTGNAIVVRDTVDETFIYNDGKQVSFKGTISLFTEYPPAIDRSRIIPALQRASLLPNDDTKSLIAKANAPSKTDEAGGNKNTDESTDNTDNNNNETTSNTSNNIAKNNTTNNNGSKKQKNQDDDTRNTSSRQKNTPAPFEEKANSREEKEEKSVVVEDTPSGIRFSLRNLQFKADSDELLPGQTEVLDNIASVLKEAPQSQFLVVGHTASTGNPKGEQALSEKRAYSIALELTKRGIPSEKFICKGNGGRNPIADNTTEQGKKKNRRVEITILEG